MFASKPGSGRPGVHLGFFGLEAQVAYKTAAAATAEAKIAAQTAAAAKVKAQEAEVAKAAAQQVLVAARAKLEAVAAKLAEAREAKAKVGAELAAAKLTAAKLAEVEEALARGESAIALLSLSKFDSSLPGGVDHHGNNLLHRVVSNFDVSALKLVLDHYGSAVFLQLAEAKNAFGETPLLSVIRLAKVPYFSASAIPVVIELANMISACRGVFLGPSSSGVLNPMPSFSFASSVVSAVGADCASAMDDASSASSSSERKAGY